MSFHVGQKVVCVRDGWAFPGCRLPPPNLPKCGETYVIRSAEPAALYPGQALRLHWLINPPIILPSGVQYEPAFCVIGCDGVMNFRPVIERKTDISIFTKSLTPSGKRLERA